MLCSCPVFCWYDILYKPKLVTFDIWFFKMQ
jgi:hypothetical protein